MSFFPMCLALPGELIIIEYCSECDVFSLAVGNCGLGRVILQSWFVCKFSV